MPEIWTRRGVLMTAAAVGALALDSAAFAKPDDARYSWRNAEMVGGGFVPGIVFKQAEPGLGYARTDIGCGYRLGRASSRWAPLRDWVSWDKWGWTGEASLTTDGV